MTGPNLGTDATALAGPLHDVFPGRCPRRRRALPSL